MIVRLNFPEWGDCIYDLTPKPSEFDEFRQQAGVWTFWRNGIRRAYEDANFWVDAGGQLLGWNTRVDIPDQADRLIDGDLLPFADTVLSFTACI